MRVNNWLFSDCEWKTRQRTDIRMQNKSPPALFSFIPTSVCLWSRRMARYLQFAALMMMMELTHNTVHVRLLVKSKKNCINNNDEAGDFELQKSKRIYSRMEPQGGYLILICSAWSTSKCYLLYSPECSSFLRSGCMPNDSWLSN